MSSDRVVVVGGGLAGLACALHVSRAGREVVLLEASDAVGGRVRTDRQDGFLLDRGFQVLLTAYPEFRALVDEAPLALGRFEPGALVRVNGRFERVVDPLRRPAALLGSLRARVGSFGDKLRMLRLRRDTTRGRLEDLLARPETTALQALQDRGFRAEMIDRFFRPFLGGIFLDASLQTSSRMMEFVLRMFTQGDAALPAEGIEALPRALAAQLVPGTVRTGCRVTQVDPGGVVLESGEAVQGTVVLAVDGDASARLAGAEVASDWHGTTCLYFAAPESPLRVPLLALNGEGRGTINSLCVPSDVQPAYARSGALVSVTVLGADGSPDPKSSVQTELEDWFGPSVAHWKHLRTYAIPRALPAQNTVHGTPRTVTESNVLVCGDHCSTPSVQGALASGRATATALLGADGRL